MICAVAGAIDWLPKSFVATDGNDRLVTVALGLVVGCLVGAFCEGVVVVMWNTIVLPAALLRYTTAPLAKVALGLGLLINGLVLAAMPQIQLDDALAPHGHNPLQIVAILLEILGPILCLEMAAKVRSSGILLSAVALQVSALLRNAGNPSRRRRRRLPRRFSFSASVRSSVSSKAMLSPPLRGSR